MESHGGGIVTYKWGQMKKALKTGGNEEKKMEK